MIELFEQNIRTNDRQSSKGNQLKWQNENNWYKADYTGYEGLVEYIVSHLLGLSNLRINEFVKYETVQIKYKSKIFNGVKSENFLKPGWQIITLERLFQNFYGQSLNQAIWSISNHEQRLLFIVNEVERITGLKEFGKYMNKLLTIDAFFLNEDRHTHNIAVLMNENGEFDYCPIFDNGAGLLADTTLDYPLDGNVYKMMDEVHSKTFLLDFEEQMNISEMLYGMNLVFNFSDKDVYELLDLQEDKADKSIYPIEIRERVKTILLEQMRKYPYLFK